MTRVLVVVFLALMVGCAMKPKPDEPISPAADFDLDDREQQRLVERANRGDGAAALRLANYHLFITDNIDEAVRWLKKSAEAGNATAQYNLAVIYLNNERLQDRGQAKLLLEAAAKKGDEEARKLLQEEFPEGGTPRPE